MEAEHGAVENGSRPGDAGDIFHRLLFEIPCPDADRELRGIADAPVIMKV